MLKKVANLEEEKVRSSTAEEKYFIIQRYEKFDSN
jgi:hypothetical protein